MKTDEIIISRRHIIVFLASIFVLGLILFAFYSIDKFKSEKLYEKQQSRLDQFYKSDVFRNFINIFLPDKNENSKDINFFIEQTEELYPEWKNFTIIIFANNQYYYFEKYERFSTVSNIKSSTKLLVNLKNYSDLLIENKEEQKKYFLKKLTKEHYFTHLSGRPEAFIVVRIDKE